MVPRLDRQRPSVARSFMGGGSPRWRRRAAVPLSSGLVLLILLFEPFVALAFTAAPSSYCAVSARTTSSGRSSAVALKSSSLGHGDDNGCCDQPPTMEQYIRGFAVASALAASTAFGVLGAPGCAFADEWGKETEAPTLFTGETVMICKKRGPLGACTETVVRTVENDNDKASKYFKDPGELVKKKNDAMRASDDSEGNALIQKLRQQTEDNRERNERIVTQKTIENDLSASFGPFSQQVVIMNTDGETYTLLQNPQAMRLKKAGYIEGRRFVKQPTQEVINDALESPDFGESLKGIFGGD